MSGRFQIFARQVLALMVAYGGMITAERLTARVVQTYKVLIIYIRVAKIHSKCLNRPLTKKGPIWISFRSALGCTGKARFGLHCMHAWEDQIRISYSCRLLHRGGSIRISFRLHWAGCKACNGEAQFGLAASPALHGKALFGLAVGCTGNAQFRLGG